MQYKKQQQQSGQALITAVIFFLVGSLLMVSGIAKPVLRDIRTVGDAIQSKKSYLFAEGAAEEVAYRVLNGYSYDSAESLSEDAVSATITASNTGGSLEILSEGDIGDVIRKSLLTLQGGMSISVPYSIQTDGGGFLFANNTAVTGGVVSNGPVQLSGVANSLSFIGNVISTGEDGLISNANVTGNAYANDIQNSTISGDAYYQSISGSSVGGTSYPGSADIDIIPLPITDDDITQMKELAEAGGTIGSPCPYVISSSQTLGPVKIECDLEIRNGTVTLQGNVWVVGNVTISQIPSPSVQIDSSLSGTSFAIIADSPGDNVSNGTISAQNNSTFGAPDNSFISLISANTSASEGGNVVAVRAVNNVQGTDGEAAPVFLYAPYGQVQILNNAKVSGAAGYKVVTRNNAVVTYQSAMTNMVFPSSSGFTITDWMETQ